jgi:hypothetical protein
MKYLLKFNWIERLRATCGASILRPGCGALELHWGQALDKLGRHGDAQQYYQLAQQHDASLTAVEQATLAKLLSG